MRTRFLLVATTALLLLTAIPAQAQDVGIKNPTDPSLTTLYMHVINVQDMPINTQEPDPSFTETGEWGPTSMTLKCLDPITGDIGGTGQGTGGMTSQIFHTSRGYSSPSYVEYDYRSPDGTPRTHPERGISYDAMIDPASPFTLKWYVATYNGGDGGTPQDQIPTPTPGIVVQASIRAGEAISVDDKAYDSGPFIASGKTDPAILLPKDFPAPGAPGPQTWPTPGDHPQVRYVNMIDGRHVYEFTIDMKLASGVTGIQRATGFNVRIDMYLDNPACPNQDEPSAEYFMTSSIIPFTNVDNRPRMELFVTNPIRLEYLHPQFVGDDLVVHTSMNSVWGNYDVDELSDPTAGGITVTIDGPSAANSLAKAALVQRFHEHYHHQEAVDVTYVWPYKTDRAANGLYTVFVSFENDQHTAKATGTAQFEVGKGTVIGCGGVQEASQKLNDDCAKSIQTAGQDQTEDAPGLPLVGALAAIGAAAVLLRRRQA
ncbi:MAG: hypothetical protein AABY18_07690 [Candidatus Thermoplasmatota archaeon]